LMDGRYSDMASSRRKEVPGYGLLRVRGARVFDMTWLVNAVLRRNDVRRDSAIAVATRGGNGAFHGARRLLCDPPLAYTRHRACALCVSYLARLRFFSNAWRIARCRVARQQRLWRYRFVADRDAVVGGVRVAYTCLLPPTIFTIIPLRVLRSTTPFFAVSYDVRAYALSARTAGTVFATLRVAFMQTRRFVCNHPLLRIIAAWMAAVTGRTRFITCTTCIPGVARSVIARFRDTAPSFLSFLTFSIRRTSGFVHWMVPKVWFILVLGSCTVLVCTFGIYGSFGFRGSRFLRSRMDVQHRAPDGRHRAA